MSEFEVHALMLSLKVSLTAVAVSLPPGIALAWALSRLRFPGQTIVEGLVHLPLVVPPVAVGYLLLLLLGRNGILGAWLFETFGVRVAFTWQGAAIAAAVMGFPLMVRAIRLSLDAVDAELEDAARTLGAGRWRVFLTVTLPLTLPGIVTGCVLGFARALGEFGATITFAANIPGETRTLPLALYTALQLPEGEAAAARLAVISIVLALAALAVSEVLGRMAQRHRDRRRPGA
ncbi:MAG: molybdate ABC transporter permease subunit [Alphaproteobacteria bacterium]